jgi:integrase
VSRESWGKGNIFLRRRTYWIRYPYAGKERRESTHTDDKAKAERLLHKRLDAVDEGRPLIDVSKRKATVNDLIDALEADYEMKRRRSQRTLRSLMKHVRDAIGGMRALHVSADDWRNYVVARQRENAAPATIARELAHLRSAFQIALDSDRIIKIPKFPTVTVHNARDVLIQPGDAGRLLAAMPDWLRDAVEFELRTGWRGIEMRQLRWADVLWDAGVIRLREANSKNDEARDFPLVGVVREIIERARTRCTPACQHVFHKNGKPLTDRYRVHFERAAVTIGLGQFDAQGKYAGVKPHDCRRAFITNGINEGIDPQILKKLSGHKSDVVFRRYHIIRTPDLARAVERLDGYLESHSKNSKVVGAGRFAQKPRTGTDGD